MMGYAPFAMVWVVPETDDAITGMDPPTKWARRILNPTIFLSIQLAWNIFQWL
jgi:hypothetical protein